MLKPIIKRFDIQITANNQSITKPFELDKNVIAVNGMLLTSDKDDLLYYRGSQKIEMNGDECFPDNYESKLLMSGINVPPNQRYYKLDNTSPGNGTIKFSYQDNEDGRGQFTPYRVSLYVYCFIESNI